MSGCAAAPQHPVWWSIADRPGPEAQQIRRCPDFANDAQDAAAA
jgi:hypothetical protein